MMAKRSSSDPIRVVVVDDSTTARELLVTLLQNADGIQVVGAASNGAQAIRLTKRLRPDVVTMDVFMPGMDGLAATRHIMREVPTPIVIVTATLMRDDMDLTFEALRAGALTALRKPGLADPETCAQVVQAVQLMADVPVVRRWDRDKRPSQRVQPVEPPALSKDDSRRVQIVGIASSTGGPAALAAVLGPLTADFPAPILVVQHVTHGFTRGLADWLDGTTELRINLASHGEKPQRGTVLLAPEDYHMRVNTRGVVELCKEPPYKGLRPSANYLFHSLAQAYGSRALGIVLTGMGDDGAEGMEALYRAGGMTIAQDEASCVVYGMPREAIVRNAVDLVLSLNQIAVALSRLEQKPS
jgi:two-component system chemotaxis response regulator CheB